MGLVDRYSLIAIMQSHYITSPSAQVPCAQLFVTSWSGAIQIGSWHKWAAWQIKQGLHRYQP